MTRAKCRAQPGEGSRTDVPDRDLGVQGNPFELEGSEDPNNLTRPGSGDEPPAMTLEGNPGGAAGASAPSGGGPVDATGESNLAPVERWGIVQKYFSPEEK